MPYRRDENSTPDGALDERRCTGTKLQVACAVRAQNERRDANSSTARSCGCDCSRQQPCSCWALLLGAYNGKGESTSGSPSGTSSAPCDAAAMVAALQADHGAQVRTVYNNHLASAGKLAKIS